VELQSQQGAYSNNSDYVRDLIRRDQYQVTKLKAMQEAITKGLDSGEAKVFDKESFKKRMRVVCKWTVLGYFPQLKMI
jgi:antitoxin ParD1/3/4